jgi:hypothetical protein
LLDAAPNDPEFETHVLKAAEIYNKSDPAKAVPLIHRYLHKNPDSALAHLAMAESAGILGDIRGATQYYQCAVELNRAYRDPDFEEKYGIELDNAPTPLTAKTETVPVALLKKEMSAREATQPVPTGSSIPAKKRSSRAETSASGNAAGWVAMILVALGVFVLCWLVLILVLQFMLSSG